MTSALHRKEWSASGPEAAVTTGGWVSPRADLCRRNKVPTLGRSELEVCFCLTCSLHTIVPSSPGSGNSQQSLDNIAPSSPGSRNRQQSLDTIAPSSPGSRNRQQSLDTIAPSSPGSGNNQQSLDTTAPSSPGSRSTQRTRNRGHL
jgi:hypothetical protein